MGRRTSERERIAFVSEHRGGASYRELAENVCVIGVGRDGKANSVLLLGKVAGQASYNALTHSCDM